MYEYLNSYPDSSEFVIEFHCAFENSCDQNGNCVHILVLEKMDQDLGSYLEERKPPFERAVKEAFMLKAVKCIEFLHDSNIVVSPPPPVLSPYRGIRQTAAYYCK